MLLKIDEKKEKLLWELGFLAVYAVLLTQYFINTTVIHLEIPYLIPNIVSYRLWIRLFAITFVALKTARDERFSWKELIFCGILIISFGRCAQVAGYMELVDLAVLIIGARQVDYKKILMLYCGVSGVLIVGTVGASLTGVVEDWVFYRDVVIAKHSFGFMYPNEFAAHVFFWFLGWSALRRERLSCVEMIFYAVVAVLLWKYCYAKTNVICIFLLIIGMIFCKFVKKLDAEKHEKWLKIVRGVLAILPVVLCVGMIALSYFYDETNEFTSMLNENFFSNRLRLGRNAFRNYGVKLFGQYIEMVGISWPTTNYAALNFLDCSYMTILIRFGLAGFTSVCLLFVVVVSKAVKKKDVLLVGLVALCAVQCTMEHHLHEIAYNPLVLAVFATFLEKSEKENDRECIIVV